MGRFARQRGGGGPRGGGGGGGPGGGTYADRMRFGNMSPEERREQMKQRKLQFDTKLALENLRRQMSKGGGDSNDNERERRRGE